jgi:peptide/nickel transport system ATP-binding protein
MRQRICISMALGVSKALLIADEPDTSLDVTIKDQILRLLSELVEKRNTSIILISHTLGAIKHMANRIYVMYAGSIMEEAKIEEFFDNPLHPYSQGLVGSVPKLTGDGIGEGIDGRIIDYINPPTGCRFHPRCKHMMPICKERKPPLCKVNKDHRVACFLFQGF